MFSLPVACTSSSTSSSRVSIKLRDAFLNRFLLSAFFLVFSTIVVFFFREGCSSFSKSADSCLPRFLHFPHPPLPLQVLPPLILHLSLGSRKKSILKKQMVVTDDGEETSKEHTQSNGCRDKCKGSRKKALVKSFLFIE